MTDALHGAAALIREAYVTGMPCAPVRERLTHGSIDQAYAVQNINTQLWLAEGRRLVGRKIGLTSRAVQSQLGVDQPDYGMLFADMARMDGEEIALDRLLQPKAEAEIAFVLQRDLTETRHTAADVISAIAYALPAIEVVDSRIANWDIGIVDTVADNASSGLFVLGATPRRLADFDVSMCGMVMERLGAQISVGSGMACLGNPLNAVRWLADMMVQVGRPLSAGDVVMSGALGAMVAVSPGDVIEARINGLGAVRAEFGWGAGRG